MRGRLAQADPDSEDERWSFVGTGMLRTRACVVLKQSIITWTVEECLAALAETVLDSPPLVNRMLLCYQPLYQCESCGSNM